MQKNNRREFLKKLMLGTAAASVATGAAVTNTGIKSGKSKTKEVLYKRTPTWEFYYKQAN